MNVVRRLPLVAVTILLTTAIACSAGGTQDPSPAPVAGVQIQPPSAYVAPGDTVSFSASVPSAPQAVTWSVQESGGGSVTESGIYTAPQETGTYHVVAQSADGTQSAEATINVSTTPPPPQGGPQFYVATNGNDSDPGTEAQPWRTIQKAMNSATAGSTVNIRGGTYNERLVVNVSGSSGNYITFQPYGFDVTSARCGGYTGVACGGERVVLDYAYLGTNTSATPLLLISGKSYIRIQGLTFQNFTCTGAMQQGIRVDGPSSYVELKYNRILNARNVGGQAGQHTDALAPLRVWGGWDGASNVTIYGNELGNLRVSDGEAITSQGASYMTIENNWLHDIDAIGIDCAWGGSTSNVVRGNRLEYVAKSRDGSLAVPGAYSAGIYLSGASDSVVERNSCNYCANALQIVSEPGYPATHDNVIRNNVVANSSSGIVIGSWYVSSDDGSVYNIAVENNTFYGNDVGMQIRPFSPGGVRWKNNVFSNNGTNYANSGGWTPGNADYNLYSGGNSGPDAHPVLASPQFTNAGAGDFTLAAGSPAIDAGDPGASTSDVGTTDFAGLSRILGGRVDIGAYERP